MQKILKSSFVLLTNEIRAEFKALWVINDEKNWWLAQWWRAITSVRQRDGDAGIMTKGADNALPW